MKNEKRPVRGKLLRKTGFWAALALVSVVGVCVLVVLMSRRVPGAYQPATPVNGQQVSPYLTHKLGPEFFNQVQFEEPFMLEVEEAGLNDILVRLPWPQPLGGDALFSKPAVIFADGTIYLMGTLEYKGVSSVVTLKSEPYLTPEGQISFNVKSIRLGLLPVTGIVGKIARQVFADNQSAFEGEPRAQEQVKAIVENQPFDPVFTLSNREVKIRNFTLKTGLLTLTCEPTRRGKPDPD